MRAVIQRVRSASVQVDGQVVGRIGRGLLVFLGVGHGDGEREAAYLADKVAQLRIFEDEHGKMNLAAADVGAQFLVVSQFTLYGDIRKGRAPASPRPRRRSRPGPCTSGSRSFCGNGGSTWNPGSLAPTCWCSWRTMGR